LKFAGLPNRGSVPLCEDLSIYFLLGSAARTQVLESTNERRFIESFSNVQVCFLVLPSVLFIAKILCSVSLHIVVFIQILWSG